MMIRVIFLVIIFSIYGTAMATNAYDFEFNNIDGKSKIKLKDYNGKLILVVNTASLCGFTKQYADLEAIWQKYKDKGLVLIAVPSNNFGHQEPASNQEIAQFCEVNFNITFLIAEKVDVVGNNSHPFFNWTRQKFGWLSGPKWNFYKYIIGKDGELITWFAAFTSPSSSKITKVIDQNL